MSNPTLNYVMPKTRDQAREFGEYYRTQWWYADAAITTLSGDARLIESDRDNLLIDSGNLQGSISRLETTLVGENDHYNQLLDDLNVLMSANPQDPVAISNKEQTISDVRYLIMSIENDISRLKYDLMFKNAELGRMEDQLKVVKSDITYYADAKPTIENHITDINQFLYEVAKNDLIDRDLGNSYLASVELSQPIIDNLQYLVDKEYDEISKILESGSKPPEDRLLNLFELEKRLEMVIKEKDRQEEIAKSSGDIYNGIDLFADKMIGKLQSDPNIKGLVPMFRNNGG